MRTIIFSLLLITANVMANPTYVQADGSNIYLDEYDMKNHNYRICQYDGDTKCILVQNTYRLSAPMETDPSKSTDKLK